MPHFRFEKAQVDKLIEHVVGRPTKYEPEWMLPKVIELSTAGESKQYIAVMLGINEDTLYDWIKKFPPFSEAVTTGKTASEAVWIKEFDYAILLDKYGWAGYQMQMRNRFGWDKSTTDQKLGVPGWSGASYDKKCTLIDTLLEDGKLTLDQWSKMHDTISQHFSNREVAERIKAQEEHKNDKQKEIR